MGRTVPVRAPERVRQEAGRLAAQRGVTPGAVIAEAWERHGARGLDPWRIDRRLVEAAARMIARAAPDWVGRVVLFGSYATGRERPGSDLDLLVVVSRSEDTYADEVAFRRAIRPLQVPTDVVVVTEDDVTSPLPGLPARFLAAALAEGVDLPCR